MASSDTRTALLSATRETIAEDGLGAVTAREVAGRAQANLASIGYHFGSKDAMVAEALVDEVTDLLAPVLALLESNDAPAEKASAAITTLNDLFASAAARIPAYLAALSQAPHDPEVRTRLASLFAEVRGRLAANIELQADSGQLPDWIDPIAMAALIVAVVQGVVISAALEPAATEGIAPPAVAAQFLSLLLAARTAP